VNVSANDQALNLQNAQRYF